MPVLTLVSTLSLKHRHTGAAGWLKTAPVWIEVWLELNILNSLWKLGLTFLTYISIIRWQCLWSERKPFTHDIKCFGWLRNLQKKAYKNACHLPHSNRYVIGTCPVLLWPLGQIDPLVFWYTYTVSTFDLVLSNFHWVFVGFMPQWRCESSMEVKEVWGEGGLGFPAQSAAPVTWCWMGRGWWGIGYFFF